MNYYVLARISLALLWCFTGVTSYFLAPELGYELLASIGVVDQYATWVVLSGALLDFCIGCWLISGVKIRICCVVQITTVVIYSVLLTYIDASFWLHPFGVLTKNIPIIMLILFLSKEAKKHERISVL